MFENEADDSLKGDELKATEWPELNFKRDRNKRPKTIRVKTFLILLSLIIISYGIVFGYLYYQARQILGDGNPSDLATPPKYLYTIFEGKNKFSRPMAVAVNSKGEIYVSNNSLHTVEIIQDNGIPKSFFGGPGNGDGQMFYPYGIGILPDGNILVSETGNGRVQEYTPDGNFIKTFASHFANITLKKPGALLIDSKGNVYISDLAQKSIYILDSEGNYQRTISGVDYVHGMALNDISRTLYVADSGQVKIKVFSLAQSGNRPIKEISYWQPNTRFSMVRGLSIDQFGRIYVCDTISSTIRVFDSNGEYLFSFGKQGMGDGDFIYPIGISVDHSGKIYVTDWGSNRVQVWGY